MPIVEWDGKKFEIPEEPKRYRPTVPWYKRRTRTVSLGDEPPLNKEGFWRKPEQLTVEDVFSREKADKRK